VNYYRKMNYIDSNIKKKNSKNKSRNLSKRGSSNSNDSIQKSNTSLNNLGNSSNSLFGIDMPKFFRQENPGKLQIFRSNSETEPEINTTSLNYNGYTSHDMRLLWTAFGNMPDDEKNTFLKGLVYRFSQKQIDLTCTLLNLKIEDYMVKKKKYIE